MTIGRSFSVGCIALATVASASAGQAAASPIAALGNEGSPLFWYAIGGIAVVVACFAFYRLWMQAALNEGLRQTTALREEVDRRRKSEESLLNSVDELSLTLDCIAHAVIATDNKGLVQRMNPAAQKQTGWDPVSARGRHISEVFHLVDERTRKPAANPVVNVLKGDLEGRSGPGVVLLDRAGSEHYVEDTAAPLLERDGKLTGAVLVFRDVTDHHRQELARQQAQKMESVGILAGSIAHDFNNLLGGVVGYAEILLSRTHEGDRSREQVEGILHTAQRATDLTNRLLSFASKGVIQLAPTDTHEAVREVTAILGDMVHRRITVRRQLNASSFIINGDAKQIQTALLHLAMNSRDAMPDGGILTLSTSVMNLGPEFFERVPFPPRPGRYIEISVSDTGSGMTRNVVDRLYEPFFTTKTPGEGTGLGLSVVYRIIKDHGGAIDVESHPAKGTTFRVYLPIAEGLAQPKAQPKVQQATRGIGHILVVDDEKVIRSVATDILSSLGYKIDVAESGIEAVKFIEEHPGEIGLVILDVVMPKLNGKDTFRAMKKIDPNIRVVLSSGFAIDPDIQQMINKEGLCGFVQKPYRAISLSQQVAAALATTAQ